MPSDRKGPCPHVEKGPQKGKGFHGEERGDLLYTKEMLLEVGDKYEKMIAADRAKESKYR